MPLQQGYFLGQHGEWELSCDSAHFYADMPLHRMDAGGRTAPARAAPADPPGPDHRRQNAVRPSPGAPGVILRPRVHDLRKAGDEEIRATLKALRGRCPRRARTR
ncbi:hypothetical protein ABZ914_27645 [Spirillospora sp. NPDC046719]